MTHTREQIIGSLLFRYTETGSTSDALKTLYQEGYASHGAVAVAGTQTKGRGQSGSSWESEPGSNLLCSVLLVPENMAAEQQVQLNMSIALAVSDAVKTQIQGDVRIKWPNDIYVNNRKIAGILMEGCLQGEYLRSCIAGIGINVNQDTFAFPGAASLKNIDGRTRDPEVLLKQLLSFMEKRYLAFTAGEDTSREFHLRLFRMGEAGKFLLNGEEITGTVKGMDDKGRLMLEINEKMHYFHNKEIAWVI